MSTHWRVSLLFIVGVMLAPMLWSGIACGPPPVGEPSPELPKTDGCTNCSEIVTGDGGTEPVGKEQPPLPDQPNPGDTSPPKDDTPPTDVPPTDDPTKDAGPTEQPPTDTLIPDEVVRPAIITPTGFTTDKFSTKLYTLPAVLASETKLFFAIHATVTTVFGGKTGFYRLNNTRAIRVDKTPVVGVANWKDTDIIVAQAKQLYMWDGTTLSPTNFAKNLGGATITALVERTKQSVWIGTNKSLWLLDGDKLREFKDVKDVVSLVYAPSKKILLAMDSKGSISAMQEKPAGTWNLRSFDGEGVNVKMMTSYKGAALHFWGVDANNTLLLRKVDAANAAWWLYRLKPDANDDETVNIKHVVFQKQTEHTWAMSNTMLYQLSEGNSSTFKIPTGATGIGTIKTANSTSDGSLWLSDGKKFLWIGQKAVATSFKNDVEPLVKKYCSAACHSSSGTKRKQKPYFETFAQVKAQVGRMITRMEQASGFMPPGGPRVPANEIGVFKSWVAGGHQP
jgi:hypothetical protein